MNRRDVLRMLSGAAVAPVLVPLSPQARLSLGCGLHARLSDHPSTRVLAGPQHDLVARIAEIIIPETDTPGAGTARVADFIDMLLAEWMTPAERDQVLAGLAQIDARSRAQNGAVFLERSPADQVALLESLDGVRGQAGSAEEAFRRLKELTVYGYFTSEVVVTQVLQAPLIPGRFDGCVPV